MKKILFALLLIPSLWAGAQVYNNEWIDYSKTYYKFNVGSTGLYRINQSALAGIGLGSTNATAFQLWRNGVQVPIYTSVVSGPLGASDYIEFWGERNDGKPDRNLYRDAAFQHTTKLSLETDTAAYFLTVNPAGGNLRFTNQANNVAGSGLTAEPYFMHTLGTYFNFKQNPGFAAVVGEYVYSSAYDKGEFWCSQDITPAVPLTLSHTGLNVYSAGPAASFCVGAVGNALNPREVEVNLNGNVVINNSMDLFNDAIHCNNSIPLSFLAANTTIEIKNTSFVPTDRMVASFCELTYPRTFDFGNQKNFPFSLPASGVSRLLKINNFNFGTAAPVLYDITNRQRYVGDLSDPGFVQFVIPASVNSLDLVLVNVESSNINAVNSFKTRNFTNYAQADAQADYIIISNPVLYTGAGGVNQVDQYRAYRASIAGGGFNAKIYDINELNDQFGYGIKKHPNSVRYFLKYTRANFAVAPKYVFIIGRGVAYTDYRRNENNPIADRLNLVPSFGYPASDMLLSANQGEVVPTTPIGRLAVITGDEVKLYLDKVKEYELAQKTPDCTVGGKGWMKNVVHVTGASDSILGTILCDYMGTYKRVIEDTLFGGKVITFCKNSSNGVQQLNNSDLEAAFAEGVSLITYFGHSSASTLEFNLDNPQNYNNPGKYPMFMVLGCNAGNIFTYDPLRFSTNENLSEKYVLANQRGGIAFIASTHFGIVNYLNIYANSFYNEISRRRFGQPIGDIMKQVVTDLFAATSPDDYYARLHGEQATLNGDPALRLNSQPKPDYVVEEPMVRISPTFISVAEDHFNMSAAFKNLGKAVNDSITIEVKRQYPDNSIATIYRKRIRGIRYQDTINIDIPIVPTRDKGTNKITVTVDADNNSNEMCETNNTVTKEVIIFQDELRPVYPITYSIVNRQGIKLIGSTANPLSELKTYAMEIDTTEQFNSPFKKVKTVSVIGGIVEFDPAFTFVDSTVYYWRLSPVPASGNPADYRWNNASFVYLANTGFGYNQSHYFQHVKSDKDRIVLRNDRKWEYTPIINNLFIRSGTWAQSAFQEAEMSVAVNGEPFIRNTCAFSSVVFNVFDPTTFKPWDNTTDPATNLGLYNSWPNDCFIGREHNFEYRYTDTLWRRRAMRFMDNTIPNGAYVVVRGFILDPAQFPGFPQAFVNDWKADTTHFGSGNSLYHRLRSAGFTDLDSFNRSRSWIFVYKKNDPSFTPKFTFSQGTFDKIVLSADCFTPDSLGYITSPKFGPALAWKGVKWSGTNIDALPGDAPRVQVIGVSPTGTETVLRTLDITEQDVQLTGISPVQYPYMRLKMINKDSVNLTPYQLRYWRILYDPIPEGAIAPNILFRSKDTLDVGETLDFAVAFKNISDANFDSVKVKMYVIDRNFVVRPIPIPKRKKLTTTSPNDTLTVNFPIDTRDLAGDNTLAVDVNPDNDQPEQFHFNNFLFRNFYVKPDKINPLLDVTFDGVHILNRDIVSAKPAIVVKLKDEARFLPLDDTSLVSLQLKYPDGTLRSYRFNTDTLRFTPAAPGSSDNTATLEFFPRLTTPYDEDGEDDYELIVKGKDRSGNKAGEIEYRVNFRVITKPMISNMLNYPNPFTTSTAFVFTITGAEVPDNMKIRIMTVTGKIVREVTKQELGPLHIGRNITEFKWDGTDQYGQKLANGIYLYQVIATLNGKSLDKYTDTQNGENTDKFFIKGYGKMYLMR
jgi:Peptidase family C25/CARDB